MPKLVLPSVKYKKSFLEDFLPSVDQNWDSWGKYWEKKVLIKKDFIAFVRFIKSFTRGKNLPKGYPPQTVYWLVKENKFLGYLSIRHKPTLQGHIGYEISTKFQGHGYGKLILKLGLKKAKALGIKNVLLTCDATNIRSKRVIESNGGEFEGSSSQGKGKPRKLKYWIKT